MRWPTDGSFLPGLLPAAPGSFRAAAVVPPEGIVSKPVQVPIESGRRRRRARPGALLSAPVLALCALAAGAAGAESFEVQVLRGSTVTRVRGAADGSISEVILREDPTPAPPTPGREKAPSTPGEPPPPLVVYETESRGFSGWGTIHPVGYGSRPPRYHGPRWSRPDFVARGRPGGSGGRAIHRGHRGGHRSRR